MGGSLHELEAYQVFAFRFHQRQFHILLFLSRFLLQLPFKSVELQIPLVTAITIVTCAGWGDQSDNPTLLKCMRLEETFTKAAKCFIKCPKTWIFS